ncbi:MAG TPA: ATP-binding protein [Mycobacteriales bacterium]|jgi:ABC-type branched-subunit amino acid transport system ATPase component|nr:ATP-binding protein [Mycobacteriales bacterium]
MTRLGQRSLWSLVALGILAGIEGLQSYGASLFMPQIAATLKVTALSLISVRGPAIFVAYLLPFAVPLVTERRRSAVRIWTTRISAIACAPVLALTGEVHGSWALVGVLCLGVVFATPGQVLARSIAVAEVADDFRIRALSVVQGGILLAQVLLSLGLLLEAGVSWHHALAVASVVAIVVALVASALQRSTESHAPALPPVDESANWPELLRTWQASRSLLGLAGAVTALGMLLMSYDLVLSIYLHQHWKLGVHGVSGVFLAMSLGGLLLVAAFASYGDKVLAAHPTQLARITWVALAVGSALLVIGPTLSGRTPAVVLIVAGMAIANALLPALLGLGLALVPTQQRTALSAAALVLMALGGVLGVVIAVCVADRYGAPNALVALAGVGVIGAFVLRWTIAYVELDRSRSERQSLSVRPEGAARLGALLECRDIDFSYGSLQVLFGVDAHVDDGEIVGLLGTNGAGKSTLLRVISGLGIPQAGNVTFDGRDITYLDAEARVRIGITQVPGGKAVFRSMNVVENLQSYGYTLGRDRRAIDEAIERCFEAFPRLKERRTSSAAMLSGGEQQMVALSKALILRPRVLLIDELSLGLAPVIVSRLLDMVRRINADGTAVVIVEQSVTTALSLVDRAYFMEKGEVRFDGPAADLIDRHDLLRAVFLEGAAKGALS